MSDREPPQRHSSQSSPSAKGSANTPKRRTGGDALSGRDADRRWQAMEQEGGLYTIAQIAQWLGFGGGPNSMGRQLTGKGRVLAVKRGDHFLYPGFQFDASTGRVIPAVKDVIRMGRYAGWSDEQIAQWFYTPNRRLSGKRPTDVRDNEEELLGTAAEDLRA